METLDSKDIFPVPPDWVFFSQNSLTKALCRSEELEVRSQELEVRSQESGVRSQKSGVRSQELEPLGLKPQK
ncbi:hypothetical protein [Mastigocoleus testarum]|uniref:Uncharacterized protein n=1 Tax=Mastigocoleus testarum BC008 TaxID=371196 RepID=A0A0V7ZR96_9CYAN|nr:hypothetical protein [Mastigocoleus testarum]KST66938.1 hypothetical protein BC008_27495 [Mastigocoleus testarum BC008]KST67173.1 hypothetical protein BC008_28685 [Mastigocoleus testarum BC008]